MDPQEPTTSDQVPPNPTIDPNLQPEILENPEISFEAADKLDKEGKSKEAFEMCMTISQQVFASGLLQPLDLVKAYERMGYIALKLCDYSEAHKYLNLALDFKTKYDSSHVLGIARLTGDLGRARFYDGKDNEAWDYFENSSQIILKHYGRDCFELIGAYNNLAELLQKWRKNETAVLYLEESISIGELYPNKDQGELARSHDLMGRIYCDRREYDKALEHFKETLKITEQWCGTRKHPDMAACLMSLGNVYDFQGKYEEAVQMFGEALEITVLFKGETNPSVAMCYNNIGLIYKKYGNYNAAFQYLEKSLEIKTKCFGENHPDLVSTCSNLCAMYSSRGLLNEALYYADKAHCILVVAYGPEDISVAKSYDNLGTIYYLLKDFEHAEIYYEKALDLKIKLLPVNHYDFGMAYLNVGTLYCARQKWHDSMKNLKMALKISSLHSSKPDIVVYKCYMNINRIFKNFEDLKSAESLLNKGIRALEAIYGKDRAGKELRATKIILHHFEKKTDLFDQNIGQNI